jgi:hypothetical protein
MSGPLALACMQHHLRVPASSSPSSQSLGCWTVQAPGVGDFGLSGVCVECISKRVFLLACQQAFFFWGAPGEEEYSVAHQQKEARILTQQLHLMLKLLENIEQAKAAQGAQYGGIRQVNHTMYSNAPVRGLPSPPPPHLFLGWVIQRLEFEGGRGRRRKRKGQ